MYTVLLDQIVLECRKGFSTQEGMQIPSGISEHRPAEYATGLFKHTCDVQHEAPVVPAELQLQVDILDMAGDGLSRERRPQITVPYYHALQRQLRRPYLRQRGADALGGPRAQAPCNTAPSVNARQGDLDCDSSP